MDNHTRRKTNIYWSMLWCDFIMKLIHRYQWSNVNTITIHGHFFYLVFSFSLFFAIISVYTFNIVQLVLVYRLHKRITPQHTVIRPKKRRDIEHLHMHIQKSEIDSMYNIRQYQLLQDICCLHIIEI